MKFEQFTAKLAGLMIAIAGFTAPSIAGHPWQYISGLPTGDKLTYACSGNGSVVVGLVSYPSYSAFRWTVETGIQDLGSLPGRERYEARGVSPEGTVIVGWSGVTHAWAMDSPRAFRWTAAAGMVELPPLPGATNSVAYGVSGYGSFTVGEAWSQPWTTHGPGRAVIWTNGGLPQVISPDDGSESVAYAVSADGSVVVGVHANRAFRWTSPGGLVDIGPLGSAAYAVNSDGSVVVGSSDQHAFRWTSATGMQDLGLLFQYPGASSCALSVTSDGNTVIGWSNDNHNRVFTWTQSTGMVALWYSLDNPPAVNLTTQASISADGTVVTSWLNENGGDSIFIRLNASCRADFNGDGQVDFFDYLDFVDAFSIGC